LQEGVTYGYDLKESFRRAADDESIKGILVTINSPGGTIPGSQAISDGIELYKKRTGNPVYAHIRDVGASGAYWAAVTTDRIFVDNGSVVGSIGVLMGPFVYYNNPVEEGSLLGSVTTDGGIEHTYITGGQYKDTGSPYRRMTPEERDHWQRSINYEYGVFVDHVSRYRHLQPGTIINEIKALPYDSIQAKNLKLVDEIANEDTTIEALVDKAGLGNDYQIIYEKNKSDFFTELFTVYLKTKIPTAKTNSACTMCNTPLYLYDRTYSLLERK
jgi:protease IV